MRTIVVSVAGKSCDHENDQCNDPKCRVSARVNKLEQQVTQKADDIRRAVDEASVANHAGLHETMVERLWKKKKRSLKNSWRL